MDSAHLKKHRAKRAARHAKADPAGPLPAAQFTEVPVIPAGQAEVAATSAGAIEDRSTTGADRLRRLASTLNLPVTPYHNTLTMLVRKLRGQRAYFFSLVALGAADGNDECRKVMVVFSELSQHEQTQCNLDEIALAAGVSPLKLIGVVAQVGYKADVDLSNLMRTAAHPELVEKTIESAMRIDGPHADIAQKDREWLHQGAGFIPVPRGGVQVNVNATANAAAAAVADPQASIPSFLRDARAIEAPKVAVQQEIIEGVQQDRVIMGELLEAGADVERIEWPEAVRERVEA